MNTSKYTKTPANSLIISINTIERTIAIGIETKIMTQLFYKAAIF